MRAVIPLSVLVILIVSSSGLALAAHAGDTPLETASSAVISIDNLTSNVVVEVSGPVAFERVLSIAGSRGIELLRSDPAGGILTLAPIPDDSQLAELSSVAGVVSISSEHKARTLFTPNDSSLMFQWGLDTVNAYEAWDITRGNHSVVVGVLDTGIDWNHPDLAGNIWSDADGYHGYNFISDSRIPMDDNINGYDDLGRWIPNSYTYHGTHVAGVVGAVMNNNAGVAGMAQVRLMAVKVMNDSGEGTDSTVASGIRWAVDNGADIITMSLGVDGPSTILENAIRYASSRGVFAVAASGNSGESFISYPAAYPSVVAVGAIDSAERRASFSNYGNGLDVVAPGVQIYSTQGGSGYQYLSGTSTAAPFVAGVAALMLSVNPALSPVEVGSVINATAKDISRVGYDTTAGWGIVNAFGAVEQIAGPTVTLTEYPEYAPPNSTISITWLVSGGSPGVIQRTFATWGESPTSMTQTSAEFTGTTWARFTVNDILAPDHNATLYIKVYANVDGTMYESDLLSLPIHEAPPDGLLVRFLKEVQDFVFNDLGIYNFLILLGVIVAIPAIVLATRSRRRNAVAAQARSVQATQQSRAPPQAHYIPPPPPPPRFESYVDLMGHEVLPALIKVVEGTKVVWVNRSWAPPPGIAVRSGRLDQTGEHPDGMFQSGLLIAPGDYWSVTFHKAGIYDYYLTGIWKSARVIVEPYPASGGYSTQHAS